MSARWLDWDRLGAVVGIYDQLIGDDVRMDTKKLTNNAAYTAELTVLRRFAEQRRTFLREWQPPS